MKIATWNVNGIKARIDAARTWFKAASPDIALRTDLPAAPIQQRLSRGTTI